MQHCTHVVNDQSRICITTVTVAQFCKDHASLIYGMYSRLYIGMLHRNIAPTQHQHDQALSHHVQVTVFALCIDTVHVLYPTPTLLCLFSADPEYKEAAVSTDIFVTPDGNVTWLYFAIYQSSCQIRVRFYPFDDQVVFLLLRFFSSPPHSKALRHRTSQTDIQPDRC